MKRRRFALHSLFHFVVGAMARIANAALMPRPAAVFLAVVAAGALWMTLNPLSRRGAGMRARSEINSFRWWPTQSVHAQGTGGPTFTVFDAPGAGTSMLQGTMGTHINDAGDITGVYLTAPNVAHGFIRSASGTITTFDVPGAGTSLNQGTFPASINTSGDVAGMYFDASNAYHGFVRTPAGLITGLDVPGAPTTIGHRGTLPLSMNDGGEIAGFYVDANDVRHGFLRTANGMFTTIDAPGAGTFSLQGTTALSINTAGDITGTYKDANGTTHGFWRAAATGTITAPVDAPGAGTGPGGKLTFVGTLPLSINASQNIAGVYGGTNSVYHGFVYTAGSATPAFTTFDAPGVGVGTLIRGTAPFSMNTGGDISGDYADAGGVVHGFVRTAAGIFTAPIDAPNAATNGVMSGTVLLSINTSDQITGTFEDASGVFHGFMLTLGTPPPPAATPTFSPAAGTYTSPQNVAISDTTAGATLYFTTDGSTPSPGSGTTTKYSGPIAVSTTETIMAIATATGFSNSAVASATYTINTTPPAATPTFSPGSGTYTSPQNVTISDTTAGASLYYTTDGSTPSPTMGTTKTYSGPIPVSSTETIKALATATGFSNSAVASATYTFNPDFQVLVNPTTLTIKAGQSGQATFTVTPINGFNSSVSFACSGLPSEAACNFSPASVTPNGAPASSTLTVTTTAKSTVLRLPRPSSQRLVYALLLPVLVVLLAIAARPARRGLPVLQLLGLFLLLTVASALTSCNGGSSNSGGNPGTPPGTDTVSVSAGTSGAGAISHSATLTITITQ